MCRFLFHQLIVHEVGGGNCCVKVAVGKTGKYSDGGKIVVVYIAGLCGGRYVVGEAYGNIYGFCACILFARCECPCRKDYKKSIFLNLLIVLFMCQFQFVGWCARRRTFNHSTLSGLMQYLIYIKITGNATPVVHFSRTYFYFLQRNSESVCVKFTSFHVIGR